MLQDKLNPNTRIIDLTVAQLVELIDDVMASSLARNAVENDGKANRKNLVYGLDGIAKILNCSRGTACRLKKMGAFDGAVSQCGHLIITDADKVLECAGKFVRKKQTKNK